MKFHNQGEAVLHKVICSRVLVRGIVMIVLLGALAGFLVPEAKAARASLPPQSQPTDAAKQAITFVSGKYGIPDKRLVVLGDFPTKYTYLERKFQAVTVRDSQPWGESYKLLVDLESGQIEEDITSLLDADARARKAKYGKLDPGLFTRLEQVGDDTTLPVAFWTTPKEGQTLGELEQAAFAQLERNYPEAKAVVAQGDKPLNVKDSTLAVRLASEYRAIIKKGIDARTRTLATELGSRTEKVITFESIPTVAAILSKQDIFGIEPA
jgi:hypothetical protein